MRWPRDSHVPMTEIAAEHDRRRFFRSTTPRAAGGSSRSWPGSLGTALVHRRARTCSASTSGAGCRTSGTRSRRFRSATSSPALVFQTGQTFFAGLSYYGILSAAYPGEVAFCAHRHRVCGRCGHEQFPAGEHRHLRHAAHVRRDHPERDGRRLVRRLPRAEDLLHDRRARSSTCTSSSRCPARSTRTSATSPTIRRGRS